MSKSQITSPASSRSAKPMFVVLLGTLAFSLSAIPGRAADRVPMASRSLSSEAVRTNSCDDLVDGIDGGRNSGSCEVSVSKGDDDVGSLIAHLKIEKGDIHHRDDDDHVVTTSGWIYTVEILGADGAKIPDGVLPTSPKRGKLKSFRDLTTVAKKEAIEQIKATAQKIADERERQADIDDCLVDAKTEKKIPEGRPRMRCQISRMKDMDSEEAAQYYEDNIRGKLTELVGSNEVKDQRLGYSILQDLKKARAGGKFVQESVRDITTFATEKANAQALQTEALKANAAILGMPDGPAKTQKIAQLAAMKQTMQAMQANADGFFSTTRPDQLDNVKFPKSTNFDYTAGLNLNLEDYQTRLDQMYSTITENQALMINGTAAGTGRDARAGTVANPSAPAPAMPPHPAAPATGGAAVSSANGGAPAVGSAVRIH